MNKSWNILFPNGRTCSKIDGNMANGHPAEHGASFGTATQRISFCLLIALASMVKTVLCNRGDGGILVFFIASGNVPSVSPIC